MEPTEEVRQWLTEIPALVAELTHYRTPGSAPPDPDARRPTGANPPIPINANAYDLLDTRDKGHEPEEVARLTGRLGVLPWLGLWVALAHVELEDLGETPDVCCPDRRHTITGETAWLHRWAPGVLEMHPDFHNELRKLWQELRHACRIKDPYEPRCSTCGWKVEPVYTEGDGTEDQPSLLAYWRCTGCPKTWQHLAEIQRLALTQPAMTLRQISTFLGIPLRQLYRWRDQRRFMPVNTSGGRNGTLYEVDHIRRAAQRDGNAKRVV